MTNCTPITECLACGHSELELTLDLYDQPLANNFQLQPGIQDSDRCFPLAVNRCDHCNHLQLTHAVDPALIYTHYLYVSGTSQTGRDYMEWFAKFAREQFAYWPDRVLDIGCNDGTQLDYFKQLGFRTYGVDPAENLFPISSVNHEIYCNFWNESSPEWFTEPMDAIVAQNSFAHNPNPVAWLRAAKACLREQGLIFIQTSQADMVVNGEFDTIYHEHISFYNAASMQALAQRADLHLIDVVKTPIHGTSYIFVLSKQPHNRHRVENIMATEAAAGLTRADTYQQWAQDAKNLLVDVKQTIDHHRQLGYAIVGYGAAAKGMTLINASGIRLDAVVDDNPMKQGLYCPGTTIPVVAPSYLTQFADTDHVLYVPLAWNFYTEISQRIRAVRSNANDRFMRYFPRIKIEN